MRELSLNEVNAVSGGGLDRSENNDIQWTNRKIGEPGLISSGTTIVGGAFGIVGSGVGFAIGHYAETRDYNEIGENFKNDIDKQLKDGLFHND